MISALEAVLRRVSNKVRFILMVVNEQLRIIKRKQADLVQELERLHFDKMTKKQRQARAKNAILEGEEADEEESASYDYLLSMPLWSLTLEKVEELQREQQQKEQELEALTSTPIEEMWRSDLKEFLAALREFETLGSSSAKRKKLKTDKDDDDEFTPSRNRVVIKSSPAKPPAAKRKASDPAPVDLPGTPTLPNSTTITTACARCPSRCLLLTRVCASSVILL